MNFPQPLYGPDSGGSGAAASSPSSGGASSSAPASSPSPSPSTSPSDGGGGDSAAPSLPSESGGESEQLDFSSIFGDGDSEDGTSAPAPTPVKAPPKSPTAKVEAPKAVSEPSEASPPTPAPTEPTSAAQPQLDPYDPGAIAQVLSMNEGVAIQHVADTIFKLSNEEIEALENDTVSAIPRLLAKGLVKGQMNMLQQLSRLIPAMISKHGEVTQRHSQNESRFYARWPEIRADTHGPLVLKYGAVYRQMHPDASLETMIEDLGPMVMMAAKIPPGQPQPPAAAVRANGRKAQPSPFMPAGAVAAGAVPQHGQELSAIESMFLLDE